MPGQGEDARAESQAAGMSVGVTASPKATEVNAQSNTPATSSHRTRRFGRRRSATEWRKSLAAETRPHASQRTCVAMSGTAGAEPSVEIATSAQDRWCGMAAPQ